MDPYSFPTRCLAHALGLPDFVGSLGLRCPRAVRCERVFENSTQDSAAPALALRPAG